MDLKDIKKITAFAKKSGIKALKFDGFEIEFSEAAIISMLPKPKHRPELVPMGNVPRGTIQSQTKPVEYSPSLDEINEFIYEQPKGSQAV